MKQVDYVRAHESFLWRWNPHTCRLFDPRPVGLHSDSVTTLLHKLGKAKIVFVGDSIVTEQYFSLEARPLAALVNLTHSLLLQALMGG